MCPRVFLARYIQRPINCCLWVSDLSESFESIIRSSDAGHTRVGVDQCDPDSCLLVLHALHRLTESDESLYCVDRNRAAGFECVLVKDH